MRIAKNKFVQWYGLASVVGVVLFVIGAFRNQSLDYWYLLYNLLLALIPVGLAGWVSRLLRQKEWMDWRVLAISFLWILFVPNSFYIVTDFIHLPETSRVDIVQDIIMLMQFSVLGMIAGFYSLVKMHTLLLRYFSSKLAAWVVVIVLFLCSFAIYLGRELRWNSWDIVLHPLTVVRDSVLIIIQPFAHSNAWFMMLGFLGMLGSLYLLIWCVVQDYYDRKKPATKMVTGSSTTTRKREDARRQ